MGSTVSLDTRDMATVSFKSESPFDKILTRKHNESDYKYEKYTNYISNNTGTPTKPVNLALFGLGRAGSIHLSNILGNPRVNLRYIVEADQSRWTQLKCVGTSTQHHSSTQMRLLRC